MPKIAQFSQHEGKLWVRADLDILENGSAWWSPDEQEDNYRSGYKDAIREQPRLINWLIRNYGKVKP